MEINGFENYLIYEDGRVFSKYTNKHLKPKIDKGYQRVQLYTNGKRKNVRVHRLVALHYIPNPYLKPEVDHIDGNRANNYVHNLRWVTNAENGYNSTQKNNTSGHKGIYWYRKYDKWEVRIKKHNKLYYNGCYTALEDAISARDELVLDLGIEEYYRKE